MIGALAFAAERQPRGFAGDRAEWPERAGRGPRRRRRVAPRAARSVMTLCPLASFADAMAPMHRRDVEPSHRGVLLPSLAPGVRCRLGDLSRGPRTAGATDVYEATESWEGHDLSSSEDDTSQIGRRLPPLKHPECVFLPPCGVRIRPSLNGNVVGRYLTSCGQPRQRQRRRFVRPPHGADRSRSSAVSNAHALLRHHRRSLQGSCDWTSDPPSSWAHARVRTCSRSGSLRHCARAGRTARRTNAIPVCG